MVQHGVGAVSSFGIDFSGFSFFSKRGELFRQEKADVWMDKLSAENMQYVFRNYTSRTRNVMCPGQRITKIHLPKIEWAHI